LTLTKPTPQIELPAVPNTQFQKRLEELFRNYIELKKIFDSVPMNGGKPILSEGTRESGLFITGAWRTAGNLHTAVSQLQNEDLEARELLASLPEPSPAEQRVVPFDQHKILQPSRRPRKSFKIDSDGSGGEAA